MLETILGCHILFDPLEQNSMVGVRNPPLKALSNAASPLNTND